MLCAQPSRRLGTGKSSDREEPRLLRVGLIYGRHNPFGSNVTSKRSEPYSPVIVFVAVSKFRVA